MLTKITVVKRYPWNSCNIVLIYIGYKVGSVLGMIFAVPIGIIIINMYKAGAFDYILDDAKILLEGILSLREK